MSYTEYGPGLNGWPAHGFTDMRDTHVVCYCGAEFTSKMALNQHSEAEARAPLDATIATLRAERDEAQMEYGDACMTMDDQRATIEALRAALDGLVEASAAFDHGTYDYLAEISALTEEGEREVNAFRAALATAKRTGK